MFKRYLPEIIFVISLWVVALIVKYYQIIIDNFDLADFSSFSVKFFLIAFSIYLLLRNFLTLLNLRPTNLVKLPLFRIPSVNNWLDLLVIKKLFLVKAKIPLARWQKLVEYSKTIPLEKPTILADSIQVTSNVINNKNIQGVMIEWIFFDQLPINISHCLIYIPDADMTFAMQLQELRKLTTEAEIVLLLSNPEPTKVDIELQAYCAIKTNNYVFITSEQQTEWLLSNNPQDILLSLLIKQLPFTRFSPYQTHGGITKPQSFYGRDGILTKIINREKQNFLITGGRQLGKTSILKAVQRSFHKNNKAICHYISLRDHRITERLAMQFRLPMVSTLDEIIIYIIKNYTNKKLTILIDEADLFIAYEQQTGYKQLSALRSLTDEGNCKFIIAGFWDLYSAVILYYQSPIKNFGEVIAIGGLEREAAYNLIIQPISKLNVSFSSPDLVEKIVDYTGQRANLIAIICQETLFQLNEGEKVITPQHLQQALESVSIKEALSGWQRLTHNELDSKIDRIIIYHTVCVDYTDLQSLLDLLNPFEIKSTLTLLQDSLTRLTLAYILQLKKDKYSFIVPLFKQQFCKKEVELLLKQELKAFDDKYDVNV